MALRPKPMPQSARRCRLLCQSESQRQQSSMGFPVLHDRYPRFLRVVMFLIDLSMQNNMHSLMINAQNSNKHQADADVNGLIDYEEFVTATVHMNKMDREEHLYTTFQFFDKDNSGYITRDEIKKAFKEKGMYGAKEIKEIISEADTVKRVVLIPVLEGRDLIARAKTRTEKTLA
ncbi:hypothetical protein ZWY2020_014356 [Hordeum vulgare]|nr:hypothetical protein ZWY2020_014356 [Hordeum vulgare]